MAHCMEMGNRKCEDSKPERQLLLPFASEIVRCRTLADRADLHLHRGKEDMKVIDCTTHTAFVRPKLYKRPFVG